MQNRKLVNHEIVTIAAYLVGGETEFVDTEDVAVKANEIAPGRFTWRKYKRQINIENVRTFLKDASQAKHGGYLMGSGKRGWMLTAAGSEFVLKNLPRTDHENLAAERPTEEQRQVERWKSRERGRLLETVAFKKVIGGESETITALEAQEFFRIDDYVRGDQRKQRMSRLINSFLNDPELGDAVRTIAEIIREESTHG